MHTGELDGVHTRLPRLLETNPPRPFEWAIRTLAGGENVKTARVHLAHYSLCPEYVTRVK